MTNDQFTEWLESQIQATTTFTLSITDRLTKEENKYKGAMKSAYEAALAKYREQSSWIPVTPETMPDTTAEVLVHTNTGAVKEAWCMDGVWYGAEPYDLPIKHWQKKPAPPTK